MKILGYHCDLVHCHKYETDYILEDWEKRTHFKKDAAVCDRFEIDCIEETYLHMCTLILFTRK